MQEPNWQTSRIDLIREALRQGELRLAGQLTLATSADQRATVLAGIYTAIAIGLISAISAIVALPITPHPSHADTLYRIALIAGAITGTVMFLLGALSCILATLPVQFFTPGNDPEEWYEDIRDGVCEQLAFGQQVVHYNTHIFANRTTLERNAGRFRNGALLGISAPVISLLAAGLVYLAQFGI
jgi:MFS family permease